MYPKIGVAVILKNSFQKILLGKRKGSHGTNLYGFPGGHLEMGESILDCASRECLEETGIIAKNGKIIGFTEDMFNPSKHYITFFVEFSDFLGEALTLEPEKCESWKWYDGNGLPKPLFLPIENLIKKGALN